MSRQPVILLMGPTASGKTDLAIEISRHYPVDLVSVDSALIYRGMDIGTAKPDTETLCRHPHALVNILDPAERYSAWQFVRDAQAQIERSHAAGRIPLLVGGTMLYFHALVNGLNELPESNPQLRDALAEECRQRGLAAMHEELQHVDPQAARRIRPSDPQRILRALEVHRLTGRSLSELQAEPVRPEQHDFISLSLAVADRDWLHRRIGLRFGQMLEMGFEQEVRSLRDRGDLNLEMPSMRCVGYRQMWNFLEGKLSHSEMVERAVIATRQLAKRQITWLRKFSDQGRFEVNGLDFDAIRHYVDNRLSVRD